MHTTAHREPAGWRLRHHLPLRLALLRLGFGLPLLLGGLMFAGFAIDAALDLTRADALTDVTDGVPALFVSLLFAAALLPLGWILCAARRHGFIDLASRTYVDGLDARLWRTRSAHRLDDYAALSVGVGALLDEQTRRHRTRAARVSLVPTDANRTPRLDIAMFDPARLNQARMLATQIGSDLALPVRDA